MAGRVVTFYSYKGGTGRSMALANVASLLARRQPAGSRGVLAVDWDLEAPGLHRYLRPGKEGDDRHQPGLIELFGKLQETAGYAPASAQVGAEQAADELLAAVDLERFISSTDIPGLSFLRAGCFDESYARRVMAFDWHVFHQRMPDLIPQFAHYLADRYAWILIDSRTGISDTSGICTMLMPELLVVVFTPNLQSLTGLVRLVQDAADYRRGSDDLRPLVVFPLPSRIEPARPKLLERWRLGSAGNGLEGYQRQFEALFTKVYQLPECDLTEYFDEVQVQHAPDFAYGEQIAVEVEETDTRLSLRRSYETFTDRLASVSGPWVDPQVAQAEREIDDLRERAMAALGEGDAPAAQAILMRAADLHNETSGAHAPALAAAFLDLSLQLLEAGNLADAEVMLRSAIDIAQRTFGSDDLEIVPYLEQLALALSSAGRWAEARRLIDRMLRIRTTALGKDHPAVAEGYERLGDLQLAEGKADDAEASFQRGLGIRRRVLGPDHPSIAVGLERLADIAIADGRFGEAKQYLDRALALSVDAEPEQRARILHRFGLLHVALGDTDRAEQSYREAVRESRASGAATLRTADSLDGLAKLAVERGDHKRARALLEEAHLVREEQLGPDHPATLGSIMTLGDLARAEGDLAAAKRQYRRIQSLAGRSRSRHIAEHPLAGEAVRRLGELALAEGSWSEAEHHYRESLAIKTRLAEADPGNATLQRDLSTEHARLGDLLATIGDLDEAERWLRRAADAGHHPAQTSLGMLLQQRGDLDEAERWLRRAADAGIEQAERALKRHQVRRKSGRPE
jgi:tetratricopeptide (TPR) repeat protein/cellulose biosynthesis protein BcsQ